MGDQSSGMDGYCIGVTLFGLGNSFLVSCKTNGNKWKDRTEELLETAKDLPVRIYSRMGSFSSNGTNHENVSQLGGTVQQLQAEIDTAKAELMESRRLLDQQDSELSMLRWDAANLLTLTAEFNDLKA
ncbi:UNVERIFIED_CONTAM: hypothetical protein HDU68_005143, partial [Siphonaria sp. JEL0065]